MMGTSKMNFISNKLKMIIKNQQDIWEVSFQAFSKAIIFK